MIYKHDINYLTFTAVQDSEFRLTAEGLKPPLEIDHNDNVWVTFQYNTYYDLPATTSMRFRAKNAVSKFNPIDGQPVNFYFTKGRVKASGSVMTLVDKTDKLRVLNNNITFRDLFSSCSELLTAPELPATTLSDYCYDNMFERCRNLTQAPELPATTLNEKCYSCMFYECNSLVSAPALPATKLSSNCYSNMFYGCTNLTQAPELPATTLANGCYYRMFEGCTNLTQAPELPAETLAGSCYYNMFYGCTSLTTAPTELPATETKTKCYYNMFRECTSLITAPELPATTLTDYCYSDMFDGCTNLVTPPMILPATETKPYCYQFMFRGCNKMTYAPEICIIDPISNFSMYYMFAGCSLLSFIYTHMTLWGNVQTSGSVKPETRCNSTRNWVLGIASAGTFICPKELDVSVKDANHAPFGWTINPDIWPDVPIQPPVPPPKKHSPDRITIENAKELFSGCVGDMVFLDRAYDDKGHTYYVSETTLNYYDEPAFTALYMKDSSSQTQKDFHDSIGASLPDGHLVLFSQHDIDAGATYYSRDPYVDFPTPENENGIFTIFNLNGTFWKIKDVYGEVDNMIQIQFSGLNHDHQTVE